MKYATSIRTRLSGFFAAALVIFSAGLAQADCGPFPRNQFFGSHSHDDVRAYVTKAHGGNWTPYLVALEQNLERLRQVRNTNSSTTLKVSGGTVSVTAAALSRFIFESEQWLSVARCLAEKQNLDSLADFSTAAGGDMTEVASAQMQVEMPVDATERPVARHDRIAGISNPLNIEIKASCHNGQVDFMIINDGGKWPGSGVISIFRIDGPNRQMISARRHVLSSGETKVFKVAKSKNLTGRLGIGVEPTWYSRPFQMDAYATCNK